MARIHMNKTFCSEANIVADYLVEKFWKRNLSYVDKIFYQNRRQNFAAAERAWFI